METPNAPFNHNAARYGILGVNPYGPSVLGTALETAGKTTELFGKMGENREKGLKNKLLADTLQSQIDLTNTKNATESKYAPLNAEAGLGKTRAEMQELLGRAALGNAQAREALERIKSGVYGAQAQETLAKASLLRAESGKTSASYNPTYMYDQLLKEYNASPYDSPKKLLTGNLLDEIVAGQLTPMGGKGNGSKSQGIGGGAMPTAKGGQLGAGGNGAIELNPLGGTNRSSFHQGVIQNPDGTFTTIESPTTGSATTAQMRTTAEAEMNKLYPVVQEGLAPYSGPGGSARLAIDVAKYKNSPDSTSGKEARERLLKYNLAQRYLPEIASINARQSTGAAPGIEAIREYKESMFPGLPTNLANWTVPNDVRTEAMQQYKPIQQAAVNAAIEQERQGFARQSENAPAWDQQEPAMGMGYFTRNAADEKTLNDFYGMQQQNQQQEQQKQNPIADQITALAQYSVQQGEDPKQVESRMAEINTQAEEAIAQGADPAKVAAQIAQLRQGSK